MTRLYGSPINALLAVLLLLAGTLPAAAERGEDGTLRLLLWQAPTTLNPHLSTGAKDRLAARLVYEPLASVDAEGVLVPFLAAEIPSLDNGGIAPDGRSVTWKLKQGVQWADGEPFTADDVVFTYAYVTDPEVGATTGHAYANIARVEAIDDHTVEVTFKDVDPAWTLAFVGTNGMILPRHLFGDPDAQATSAGRQALGTGPYRITAFEQEDFLIIGNDIVNTVKITYQVNPYYREPDKPYFDRVELRGGGDAKTAAQALFRDGSVDFAYNLQVDGGTLEELEALGRARLVVGPPSGVEVIALNFTDPNQATAEGERSSLAFPHPILTDWRVRQALNLGIDRAAIAALYGRAGRLVTNLLIDPKTYASPNTSWRFDLEEAAALLDQAGWADSDGDGVRDKDGVPLRLVFQTSANDLRQRVQEIVRSALGSIGIDIDIKVVDASVFFGPAANSTSTNRRFYADLSLYSRRNVSPEPESYMRQWLCSEAAQQANDWSSRNVARYCNPAYDALFEQASAELDPVRRRALYVAMNDLLIAGTVAIPLVGRAVSYGLSNEIVLGRQPTSWDYEVWDIADWQRR